MIWKMKNQQKALESLDDHVLEALDELYNLMRDDDKYVRLRAVEIVLKKVRSREIVPEAYCFSLDHFINSSRLKKSVK